MSKGSGRVHVGARFDSLVVEGEVGRDHHANVVWQCRCDCGQLTTAITNKLVRGRKRSCGCKQLEYIGESCSTHGETRGGRPSSEFSIWQGMLARCSNPDHARWHRYGGRGIKVCDRWLTFSNFLSDMGRRPSLRHSLDRKDNNGNYDPENCRWATRAEQNANMCTNVRLALDGRDLTVSEWSRETGIGVATLSQRIRHGWSAEAALTTPPDPRKVGRPRRAQEWRG